MNHGLQPIVIISNSLIIYISLKRAHFLQASNKVSIYPSIDQTDGICQFKSALILYENQIVLVPLLDGCFTRIFHPADCLINSWIGPGSHAGSEKALDFPFMFLAEIGWMTKNQRSAEFQNPVSSSGWFCRKSP